MYYFSHHNKQTNMDSDSDQKGTTPIVDHKEKEKVIGDYKYKYKTLKAKYQFAYVVAVFFMVLVAVVVIMMTIFLGKHALETSDSQEMCERMRQDAENTCMFAPNLEASDSVECDVKVKMYRDVCFANYCVDGDEEEEGIITSIVSNN